MRVRRARQLALLGALCLTSSVASAQTPAPVLPGPPAAGESWTAAVQYPVLARRTPGGRVVMRLRHHTEFSLGPAVFMVTGSRMVGTRRWIRIQLPKRPNGLNGWVPSEALVLRKHRIQIRVSTRGKTLSVFRDGKRIRRYSVGVGTGGTPTPKGQFAIYDRVATGGQLGPYILVLTAHSTVWRTFAGGDGTVGVHGWPSRGVLGKAVSNGCIRMGRTEVADLRRLATPGTPIEIT